METIEGNKLIAEFFADKVTQVADKGVAYKMYWLFGQRLKAWPVQDLEFHSSWDWLMPVVEKINKSGKMVSINFWSEAPMTECKIYNWEVGSPWQESEEEKPIDAIWKVVVEHIKYLNTTKPQPNAK